MLAKLRQRLTYANVMSTLALFVALGGSSYAALRVGSREIKDNSVRGRDVRNHSLTRHDLARNTLDGSVIRESQLARVPRAARADMADHLGELTEQDVKLKCPADTFAIADVCVESQPRPAAPYGSAVIQCAATGLAGGRRLPTHAELRAALAGTTLAAGGELTSEVWQAGATAEVEILYIIDQTGGVARTTDNDAGKKAFRCVVDPSN